MSKHTPVRLHGKGWRQDHTNGGEFVPLLGSQGEWLADIRSNGDFHKFVVTALNAHDDLLAACKESLVILPLAMDSDLDFDAKTKAAIIADYPLIVKLKAAIAKAESPAGEPR